MEESKGKEFIFTWVIENFSFCYQRYEQTFKSPMFIADNMEKSKWIVLLYPRGWKDDNYISVFLRRENYNPFSHKVNFEFQLVAVDGVLKTMRGNNHLFNTNLSPGFPDFLHRDRIINDRDFYLPHDTFTLRCRLWYPDGEILESGQCFARTRIGVERMCFVWDLAKIQQTSRVFEEGNFPHYLSIRRNSIEINEFLLDL
ncbi:speckle-type POZ protein [Caerostris extrusa]|uniref:Speckle-type POZ protein n=1 Tax=Caerostris extrusa TaxID=172846 RepID=A0AAV4NNW9_CAEEX|nr:speckle-type POZ protein [Caerostris extrusa]